MQADSGTGGPTLTRADYPAAYLAASDKSKAGQHRYLRAVLIRLCCLVAAAVGGALSWRIGDVDVFGWIALVSFLGALAAETYILATQPDRLWYEGRAGAESVKTLTWRYGVGGNPFVTSLKAVEADDLFLNRLREVLDDLSSLAITLSEPGEQITDEMRKLRSSSMVDRRRAYAKDRIVNQRTWYGENAKKNDKTAHLLLLVAIGLEFTGVVGAVLKAFTVVELDVLGILAAAAAGFAAWSQTRQYSSNAIAYSIASQELAMISSELPNIDDERWPAFVDEAEEAISREHTLWGASKGISSVRRRYKSRG